MSILIPLANGLEEIEAVTIIDVLRRAKLDVTTVAIGESKKVRGAHNIFLAADALWDDIDPDDFEAIVLPGGGEGTKNLAEDDRILDTLRSFNEEGKIVAAICAAPTVLAEAGILKNRHATCYPSCAGMLGDAYDAAAPVIADNNIITSQGPGTAMLFSLALVHHLADEGTAQQVAAGMLTQF